LAQGSDKEGLIDLLEPVLAALGFELVDLELHVGRGGLLRLFIDKMHIDKVEGVTLADCELVSQQISAFLDVEDPIPSSYVLEVSSPGIDRRLRTAQHFARFSNEEIKVELKRPRDGRRTVKGRVSDVRDDTVALDVDGEIWRLNLADIAVARLVPEK